MRFQSAREQAPIRLALAISVLLHILLFWPASPPPDGGAAAPLSATLRPVAARQARAEAPSSPAVPASRRAPSPESLPDRPPVVAGSSPDITPDLTAGAPLRSGAPGGYAKGIDGDTPASAAAMSSDSSGIDADSVRQYRLALSREARRFKRYPAGALDAGVAGRVEIRVTVAAGGFAENVQLAQSSGNSSLDDAALEMISRAVPRAAVPEPLRSRPFAVSLPIVFDLASD